MCHVNILLVLNYGYFGFKQMSFESFDCESESRYDTFPRRVVGRCALNRNIYKYLFCFVFFQTMTRCLNSVRRSCYCVLERLETQCSLQNTFRKMSSCTK